MEFKGKWVRHFLWRNSRITLKWALKLPLPVKVWKGTQPNSLIILIFTQGLERMEVYTQFTVNLANKLAYSF